MGFWADAKGYVNRSVFKATGRRPWTRGYGYYRQREIEKVLDSANFDPAAVRSGHGFRIDERVVEYPWLFARLPRGPGRLLDAGSVLNHDFLLTRPLLAEKSLYIYTLAPESRSFPHLGVSYVYGDLRDMCFADRYFDWIACLSTLEHVGMDNTMLYTGDETKREHDREAHLQALDELRRVLHPGGVLYLSFPFGRARDYGWFQVFDAAMVDTVVDRFRPVSAQMRYFRYLPHGWANCRREEAHDATYFDIHRSRDYDPDYAAASRAIACLELVR